MRPDEGSDHPSGPEVPSAGSRVGDRGPSRDPPVGVVVFGINRPDEADEVVAVLEARASMTPEDIIDHVRRRVRETAGLELDRVVIAPPGTIPAHHERQGPARRDAGTLPGRARC